MKMRNFLGLMCCLLSLAGIGCDGETSTPGDTNNGEDAGGGGVISCDAISCSAGFVCEAPNNQARCVDVDECADASTCSAEQTCLNTVGSYTCEQSDSPCLSANCGEGSLCVVEGDSFRCEDVDECAFDNVCSAGTSCVNSDGGYTCEDIDECAMAAGACPDGETCVNEVGGFRCEQAGSPCAEIDCQTGTRCVEDSGTASCEDIDECAMAGACAANESCTNLNPGFRCDEVLPPVQGCGLTNAAFCEDFETIHPGGRGGDLDESRWSFSKWSHDFGDSFYRAYAKDTKDPDREDVIDAPPRLCDGPLDNVRIADTMRICEGNAPEGGRSRQFQAAGNDTSDFFLNSMMIRKPFDFTDRTGTLVFDVDAKNIVSGGGHGWWVEVFISEAPTPIAYQESANVYSLPQNGIGFEFTAAGHAPCRTNASNMLANVVVIRDHQVHRSLKSGDHFQRACIEAIDDRPNRFEFRISRNNAEVWASDSSTPMNLVKIAEIPNIDLNFERGFVTLHHVGYNAQKDNALPTQTYRWDNIGFDGPNLPFLRSYDIPDKYVEAPNKRRPGEYFGYTVPRGGTHSFAFEGVDLSGMSEAMFNGSFYYTREMEFRVNGGGWHQIAEYGDPDNGVRTFSETFPISELNAGSNQIEVRREGGGELRVGNIDLSLR